MLLCLRGTGRTFRRAALFSSASAAGGEQRCPRGIQNVPWRIFFAVILFTCDVTQTHLHGSSGQAVLVTNWAAGLALGVLFVVGQRV